MRYGRQDVEKSEDCPPEGNLPGLESLKLGRVANIERERERTLVYLFVWTSLPGAEAPFPDEAPTPGQHLKNIFYRMGLDDKDIVALSGAHTIGIKVDVLRPFFLVFALPLSLSYVTR